MTEKIQEEITAECDERFSEHEIRRRGENQVFLSRPNTGDMSCTIFLAGNRHLAVIGDIDAVVFSYYNGPPQPGATRLSSAIRWMGHREIPDSYVQEKARIGMGSKTHWVLNDYDGDLFEKDARAEINNLIQAYGRDGEFQISWDEFENDFYAHGFIGDRTATPASFVDYLWKNGIRDSTEWVFDLGQRPSMRLHTAHAALRRAHAILSGENDNG